MATAPFYNFKTIDRGNFDIIKSMLGYVYIITNLVNYMRYTGSTMDPDMRAYNHFRDLKNNKHENPYLQNAWNKYREENFEFKVIATAIDVTREDLHIIEGDYIDRLNTMYPHGYNICRPEGNTPPDNTGKKYPPHSEETKKKMSLAQKGKPPRHTTPHTLEAIAKISKNRKGQLVGVKNPNYGNHKPWSEARRKAEETKKNKKERG